MKPYPAQPQTEVVPQSNGFLIRVRIPNLRKRDFKAGAGIVIKAAAGNA